MPVSYLRSHIARNIALWSLLLFSPPQLFATETSTATPEQPLKSPPVECIRIDGTHYPIPSPWIGNRIVAPFLPMKAFRQIPVDHTKDRSQLYVITDAHKALVKMLNAAKEDGILLRIESGYRSIGYQKKIFARMMNEGREFADIIRYVAPPGYSEHALGTAVDFYPSNWEFARLPAYTWLQEHASRFGFTETYPANNSRNFPWESWHWTFHEPTDTAAVTQIEEVAGNKG